MMWAVERADGGRGFGFTGGHYHKNWGNDQFRKAVLNALVWVAKLDPPAEGVSSAVTAEELSQNLDQKAAPKPKTQPATGTPAKAAMLGTPERPLALNGLMARGL
jgi:hypothetical protein